MGDALESDGAPVVALLRSALRSAGEACAGVHVQHGQRIQAGRQCNSAKVCSLRVSVPGSIISA